MFNLSKDSIATGTAMLVMAPCIAIVGAVKNPNRAEALSNALLVFRAGICLLFKRTIK